MSDIPPVDPIQADIQIIDQIVSPLAAAFDPVVAKGVHLALGLLAIAEPPVYAAIKAAVQGTDLTDQQEKEKQDAIERLENPGQYFA